MAESDIQDLYPDIMEPEEYERFQAAQDRFKESQVPGPAWPNLADRIRAYVAREFPELAKITYRPGVSRDNRPGSRRDYLVWGAWLTGSRIWRHAYEVQPEPTADWDIFVSNEFEHAAVSNMLNALRVPKPEGAKDKTSSGGDITYTSRGRVDLWVSPYGPYMALLNYPPSHAHCRVAYNPSFNAVVMLPTERNSRDPKVTTADYEEQHERLALFHTEAAERMKNERQA